MTRSRQPPRGDVDSLFLDSGSFSLWRKAKKWASETGNSEWDFYDTDEFWDYMESYVFFIKSYGDGADIYANIDAIPNPDLSWRNLKWLESKGLKPLPIIHFRTGMEWIQRHIDEGYDFIGLGGLVGSILREGCNEWLDEAFDLICDTKDRLPKVKVHGFGVTSYQMLLRYPWYSVDSTAWTKRAAYGILFVPYLRRGKFDFSRGDHYTIFVSKESPRRTGELNGLHYQHLNKSERYAFESWLEHIDVPLGRLGPDDEEVEPGVITSGYMRSLANLLFFEELRATLPEYPWPFKVDKRTRGGRGFFSGFTGKEGLV